MPSTANFPTKHSSSKSKGRPEQIPWSNQNEVRASHTTEEWTSGARDYTHQLRTKFETRDYPHQPSMKLHRQGKDVENPDPFGGRCRVSPSRRADTSPGAESSVSEVSRRDAFIESRPGVVRVPGIDGDEGSVGLEATVASREESTFEIIARVVDTEEENRRLRAQERLLLERDQLIRERDQLRQNVDNAVIVHPVVVTNRDVENGSKEVTRGVINGRDLPEHNQRKCGTGGRRWLAIGAILLIVIAIVIPLVIVLRPDPIYPNKLNCTQMEDGTCRMEDYPGEDFHVDFSCPTSASTVFDCSTCTIVSDDTGTQCNSCTVCADTVAYDCFNTAEGSCVQMDCNGNCVDSDDLAECSETADGSRSCRVEDYPEKDFHVDFSCPTSASEVLDCSTCSIVNDVTGTQCNSCTICTDTVAYDCSNTGELECASKDCSGNCNITKMEIPCTEMADGSFTCRQDDYPGEDFHVDFTCPDDATTFSDCSSCAIISDDNTNQCNSCTICTETVAYDCSNIAEGDCVKKDCSANCEGSNP